MNAVSSPPGGTSALRWSNEGSRRHRRKGAAGEYVMDAFLHRELRGGEVILNDRRVPGRGGNVDHVVVARNGVWVIDTKHWDGRIEYRGSSGIFDIDERLLVDGMDRTYLTDDLYAQVIPIAGLLSDRSIPIHPALVFVNGDWGSTFRLLTRQPYSHNGVCITWPKALIPKIKAFGQLTGDQVRTIGAQLERELAPM